MTLVQRLEQFSLKSKNQALSCKREAEDLRRQRAKLPSLIGLPAGADGELYSADKDMLRGEEKRLDSEIARRQLAERIYSRRAEYAGRGFLYQGEAERAPFNFGVDPLPPELLGDATSAGLTVWGEDDLDELRS